MLAPPSQVTSSESNHVPRLVFSEVSAQPDTCPAPCTRDPSFQSYSFLFFAPFAGIQAGIGTWL